MLWLGIILFIGVTFEAPAVKAVPTQEIITFSGRLLTKDRLRTPQGRYPFRFTLYGVAEGGTPLWAESWVGNNALTVRNGLFSVSLGSLAPLPPAVQATTSLYLMVEFDSNRDGSFEQVFQNRIAVTAAPFAVTSQHAQSATRADQATTADNAERLGGSSANELITTANSRLLGASSLLFQGNLSVAGSLNLSSLETGVVKNVGGVLTGGASTSDLIEGSNLYFTVDRARQALSAAAPLVYSSGQISLGYDGLNLTVSGSQLTTTQAIHQTASPRFSGLGLGTPAGGSLLTIASGTGTTYGLAIGSDVQLYRSGAATLRTDANFQVGESVLAVDVAGQVAINGPQTAGYVLSIYGGDANIKLQDNSANWGTPVDGSGSFIGFFDAAGVRGGWLGYGWGYTDNLVIANELPGKSLYFSTVETGETVGNDTVRLSVSPEGKMALGMGTVPPVAEFHLASSYAIGWDNGSGGVDTNLYRAGAASLKTDARLTVAGSSLTVGSDTGNVTYSLGSAAGFSGAIKWQSGGLDRWLIAKSSTAETGADAGSDLVLQRFNDAGSLLGTPLSIARSTGQVTIPSLLAQGFQVDSGVLDTAGLRFTQLTAASAASGGSGKVLSVDAQGDLILVNDQVGDSTALPSGTSGQTLRHNGSNWVATDFLTNTGSGIGIGVTVPSEELTLANNYRLGWDNGSGTVDTVLYRESAGSLKTDGAFTARKLTLAGSLAGDGSESDIYINKTVPLITSSGDTYGSRILYTNTSGSATTGFIGFEVALQSGYTGTGSTAALGYRNYSNGTANTIFRTNRGNYGVYGVTEGLTSGDNAGVTGFAAYGGRNAGVIGNAYIEKDGAANVGVFGIGLNDGVGGTQIGGYFGLRDDAPASFVSGALIADNGTTSSAIFRAFDDEQEVLTIADGGNVQATGQLQLSTSGSNGGILLGGDVNLFRGEADVLQTDDQISTASGLISRGGIVSMQGEATVVDMQPTGAAGGQRSRLLAVGQDSSTNGNLALATSRSDGTSYYEPLKINGATRAVSLTEATSAASALILGTNANLYSPSSNLLKTDSALEVGGMVLATTAADSDYAFSSQVAGDSLARFAVRTDGQLQWGSGTATRDTVLYRSAPNQLKTDDSFVALAVQAGGASGLALTIGNDAALYDANLANTFNVRGLQDAAAGAITFGSASDTNLYRGEANQLKTDDSLAISGTISIGSNSISPETGKGINLLSSAAGVPSYAAFLYNTQWGNADLYGLYTRTEVPTLNNGSSVTFSTASAVTGHLYIVPDNPGGSAESATITNAYNFWARNSNTAGVNVTNHYGLYVDSLAFGTNRWGVYVQTDPSYFGGHVTFANGTTGASSLRYKDNIRPLTDNFAAILDVQPKSFTYKDTGYQDIGVIAEEVDSLGLKNLISYDRLGRPDGVKYDRLPLYLLEVLKADHVALTSHGIRLDNLEGAVGTLAARLSALELQQGTVAGSTLSSAAGQDLRLIPGSGQIVAAGGLLVEGSLRVVGTSTLGETAVAGAFTYRDEVSDDIEFDGTEDDSTLGTVTDLAGIGLEQKEVIVTVPDQGSASYTVLVTWVNDPGQPYWVTIRNSRSFTLRLPDNVTADTSFRYALIKHGP